MERSDWQKLFNIQVSPGMSLSEFVLISFLVMLLSSLLQPVIFNVAVSLFMAWSALRITELTQRVSELEGKKKNPGNAPATGTNAGEESQNHFPGSISQMREESEEKKDMLKATEVKVSEVFPMPIQDVHAESSGSSANSGVEVGDAVQCTRLKNGSDAVPIPIQENADVTQSEAIQSNRSAEVEPNKTGVKGDAITLPYRSAKSEVTTGTVLPMRKVSPTPVSKPQLEMPAEVCKVREVLTRLSPNNLETALDNLVVLINSSSKHLPEHACMFVEKAIQDAANTTLVVAYAKLVSRIIWNPQGVRMKMLAIEVTNALMSSLAILLDLPTNATLPDFVQHLVQKRDVMEADRQKLNAGVLRFTAELFRLDVLELDDLRVGLMEPLMAKSTDETLLYVCKLLTWAGYRIHSQARDTGTEQWFANLLSTLEAKSNTTALQATTTDNLKNLIKLKNSGWDPYATDFKEDDQSTARASEVEPVKRKKRRNRKKADKGCSSEQSSTQTTTTSSFDLTYETVIASEIAVSHSSASSNCSFQSLESIEKLPLENVAEVFNKFIELHHSLREEWLKTQFGDCEEKQLRDFVRSLTRLTPKIWEWRRLNLMGMMLDLLVTTNIVSEDLLIRAIMSGIVSDLAMYHREKAPDFLRMVRSISIVLVKCWEKRMQDFSWLIKLGKHQHAVFPSTWKVFRAQVLDIVLLLKKKDHTRDLLINTQEGQDLLLPAAYELKIVEKPEGLSMANDDS